MPPNFPPSIAMTHPTKKSDLSIRPARIIPAIPLPYSRIPGHKKTDEPKQSQRALTPDRVEKSTDSPRNNSTQHDSNESQSTSGIQEPMTPDSLASAVIKEAANGETPEVDVDRQEQEGVWNTLGEIYPTFTLVSVFT
jgi:hypothetical protein